LEPVAALGRIQLFLVVRSETPWKSFADLVRAAKAAPGKLSYGSPGSGTSPHLAGEMFKSQTGTFVVHVPYRGSAPALQDLLGGQLDYLFDPGIALQHVRSGKLRLLAVTSLKRMPSWPDAPTLNELGLKDFDGGTTHAMYAPRGTPPASIARMNTEVNRVLSSPAGRGPIEALGGEVATMSPAQLAALSRADMARFAVIVKERKIGKDS
jgi:tripartite-type tricarboxylate transporter receptor subunit TctC